MHRFIPIALLFLALGMTLSEAAPKRRANQAPQNPPDEFRKFVEACFPRWDRNRDSSIDIEEINTLIESPAIRGNEAAAIVVIRRCIKPNKDTKPTPLTREQFLAFASDPATAREFSKVRTHINSIPRILFMNGEPNLTTFHQGGVGDCYLLSMVGAVVYRNPQEIRSMFRTFPGNVIEVHFGNGRIVKVPPITDAELVMGARMGADHGIWLSVLEKAYSFLRTDRKEQRSGKTIDEDDAVTKDLIAGGSCGPVIENLTGHHADRVSLVPAGRENVEKNAERIHELLTRLAREKRLMGTSGTKHMGDKLPKGIINGHVWGVVGYDPARRLVRVFNPWGNNRTPDGPPGLINGYVTRHGLFDVPLKEFIQIYSHIVFETDKSLK